MNILIDDNYFSKEEATGMSSPFVAFNTNMEFDLKKLNKNKRNLSNLSNSLETLS